VYRSDTPVVSGIVFDPFVSPYDEHRPSRKKPPQAEEETLEGKSTKKALNDALRELKVQMLSSALREARYNQRKAARILGLTYHQFRGLYRKFSEEITSQ